MPTWSPDGTQIAYHTYSPVPDWAVYTKTLGGGEAERIAESGMYPGGFPAWSPDGTEIVFAAAHAMGPPPSPLVIHNLHTGEEETFHPQPQLRMFYPASAPDGTIAFSHVERLGLAVRSREPSTPSIAMVVV